VLADRGLARASEQFVEQNVELITSIPKRLHAEVETMVQSALESSRMSPKLSKHIEERFGVAQRHARLIARDQIGKHHGKLNRIRQQELDITSFIWRSVGDERVRDWHRDELDGNEYAWDELPLSERGEPIAPGDDFQCRCQAEMVL
jgi:SPP1 gp7 family putative phage head morphogenesis protein